MLFFLSLNKLSNAILSPVLVRSSQKPENLSPYKHLATPHRSQEPLLSDCLINESSPDRSFPALNLKFTAPHLKESL